MSKQADSDLIRFIRKEMDRKGYRKQIQLATHAGLSTQAISQILSGKRVPDASTCEKLALALDSNPLYLLQLAGHITPEESDSLEGAIRQLSTRFLPADVSPQAIDKIAHRCQQVFREVRFEHGIVLDEDKKWAEARIEEGDFHHRAIDPVTGEVLTAVYESGWTFYVTGQLNEIGEETRLADVKRTLWRGDNWEQLERKFSLQVWPIVRGHGGSMDEPLATHFWIPEYGDQEQTWRFRFVEPSGEDEEIRDALVHKMQRRASEPRLDIADAIRERERAYAKELEEMEGVISSGLAIKQPKSIAINPDTLSYLMLLGQIAEAKFYWILEGKLDELSNPVWTRDMTTRVQRRHEYMVGSWQNLLHLGGYCLHVFPKEGFLGEFLHTGVRHTNGMHFVLHWKNQRGRCFGVGNPDLGTWRVWQVSEMKGKFAGIVQIDKEERPGSPEHRSKEIQAIVEQRIKSLGEDNLAYQVLFDPLGWMVSSLQQL